MELSLAKEQLARQEASLCVERAELEAARAERKQTDNTRTASQSKRDSAPWSDVETEADAGYVPDVFKGGPVYRSPGSVQGGHVPLVDSNSVAPSSPARLEMCRWIVDVISGNSFPGQINEVEMLLRHLGLGHYAAVLQREEIHTLPMLAQLDLEILDEIGIKTRAARMKILEGARGLRTLLDGSR